MAPASELRKSLHFTNAWHAKSGGIRTFYKALLEAAERRKHLLRLVVPGAEDRVEEVGNCGRVYYVKSAPAPFDPEYRMIRPPSYLLPNSRIPRILAAERPDLVEFNDKYTLNYLGGMLRERMVWGIGWRPTVVGLSCERMDRNLRHYLFAKAPGSTGGAHGSGRQTGSLKVTFAEKLARAYMKWLYFPMFDHHIAVSEHTAAELRIASRGHKIKRGVWVLPMGVELDCFGPGRRSAAAQQWLAEVVNGEEKLTAPAGGPRAAHPCCLLYVGRLAPEKNLGLLVDLIARLVRQSDPTFHLLVAGNGPLRGWFEGEAQRLAPGRVHFLGHIDDRRRLADLYANADIFVHPNPDEPFGIALLEAMASGLPLVAPDSGGVTQYANAGNAWTVPATGESFENAIREIARDPTGALARAERALATVAGYGWDAAADSFLELYREIHRLRTGAGKQPAISPLFYSTPGDYWGRETVGASPRRAVARQA